MSDTVQLNFSDDNHFERISLIHDTVMGGRSSGHVVRYDDHVLMFSGNLSLKNNGGFASAEFTLVKPITAAHSGQLTLTAAADGRTYQLRLKTPFIPSGVAYVAEFSTQQKMADYTFDVEAFSGRYRGRIVTGLPPLRLADISHLSIMLADKTPGPFQIALYSLRYTKPQQP